MRDPFELVDLAAYMIGIALILPTVQLLGRGSLWSTTLLVLLILPVPIYIARLRLILPERIDTAFERYAYLTLFEGILVFLVVLASAGIRWMQST
jgi:hypothetical protein